MIKPPLKTIDEIEATVWYSKQTYDFLNKYQAGVKTHCKWGHPFTHANTSYLRGTRVCKKCKNSRQRKVHENRMECD